MAGDVTNGAAAGEPDMYTEARFAASRNRAQNDKLNNIKLYHVKDAVLQLAGI